MAGETTISPPHTVNGQPDSLLFIRDGEIHQVPSVKQLHAYDTAHNVGITVKAM